jgi:tight adherence protein C
MEVLVALATFMTVFLASYGLLYKQTSVNAMDARLGGLKYQRANKADLPDPEAAFSARVLRPLIKNFSRQVNSLLPSSFAERIEGALVQGGIKMKPGQFMAVVGVMIGALPLLGAVFAVSNGMGFQGTLVGFGIGAFAGGYLPRIWLLGRIKRRKKEIWKSLPDAFDLVTASVEAGLGIDAAFTRVIEKVRGPFAAELTRTMNEIQMGRSRRDAFTELAERTGVDELRSLINAVVQAESMGISIGNVIRVQTGVIRTKRKQKAEEQAMKAPIKMVFPLVFFIFPAIMVIIGGPAVIQMRDAF